MEFAAGVIATLVVEFLIYQVQQARQRRKDRKVQATRREGVGGSGPNLNNPFEPK
jgi:hypothetical protein